MADGTYLYTCIPIHRLVFSRESLPSHSSTDDRGDKQSSIIRSPLGLETATINVSIDTSDQSSIATSCTAAVHLSETIFESDLFM